MEKLLITKKFNRGFTLVETIVVISIFTLIIGILFSAITYSQRSYALGGNVAETMQNGRVIIERISREIRQAKKIITILPEEKINPPSEIKFQDGHLLEVLDESQAQGGSSNTIILSSDAPNKDDYYKDFFIKITEGSGNGQIRKIIKYDGISKVAQMDQNWIIAPDITSFYKIDSYFNYIRYYRDANNNVLREVTTCCFSEDSLTCTSPETYVSCIATPPPDQTTLEINLESPRIIGEYVSDLKFYGARLINIIMELNIREQTMQLKTKVFGRNL